MQRARHTRGLDGRASPTRVSVVEAAAAVDVRARRHHVQRLGSVALRDARSLVDAVCGDQRIGGGIQALRAEGNGGGWG